MVAIVLSTNTTRAAPPNDIAAQDSEAIEHDLVAEETFYYLKNILAATYELLNSKTAFFRANSELILPASTIIKSIAPPYPSSPFNTGLPPFGALSNPFFLPPPPPPPPVRPHHHRVPTFKKTFPNAPHPKAVIKANPPPHR